MYFKYGSFKHDDNDVNVTHVDAKRMYSPRNRLAFTRKTLHCLGHICETGQAAIKAKIEAIQAAYYDDWKDAGLYHDDGTKSAHFLDNSSSINGVRVLNLSFPKGDPAEYATGRSYSITLQADYLNVEDQIYNFSESLQFLGGCGPSWQLVPTYSGPPTLVVNSFNTVQRIIQRGTAVGLEAPPLIPGPLLPANYEHNDQRMIIRGSAQKIGRHANLMFPVQYQYVFSSVAPQNMFPRPDYPGR